MGIAQAAEGTRHPQKSFTFLSQFTLGRFSSTRERCSLLTRTPPELKEKHDFVHFLRGHPRSPCGGRKEGLQGVPGQN